MGTFQLKDWRWKRSAMCAVSAISLVAASPDDSAAQAQADLVDRVLAVVADTAILQSEIQEQIFRLQAQGGARLPTDRGEMRELTRQVLEQKINEVLIVIHATREGLTVDDAQVNDVVDQQIAGIKRQFPSELAFQQALVAGGMTAAEFRIQMEEQARARLLTEQYLGQRVSMLKPAPISEEEVRQLFEQQKASFGPKPATISLRQIIITPRPSEDAEIEALATAEEALSRATSGEDFVRLAREYSEDPNTRENGGELGWQRRGSLLPEFEEALWELSPGDVSGLVQTSLGYHIIKLDRIRGAERFARHILIRADITAADRAATEQSAREVASAWRAGADPDSLVFRYHDPEEQDRVTVAQDRLPPAYRQSLAAASAGDIVGPFELSLPGLDISKFAVVRVEELNAGGEWQLDDVRDQIRLQLQQDKMLEQVILDLREKTYIEAREDAADQLADLLLLQMSSVNTQ